MTGARTSDLLYTRLENMPLNACPPRPDTPPNNTAGESEKSELRKKLLEMIRRNESQRRKAQT